MIGLIPLDQKISYVFLLGFFALKICPNVSPKLHSQLGCGKRVESLAPCFHDSQRREENEAAWAPTHETAEGPKRDMIKTPNFLLESWPCPFRYLASTQAQLRSLSLYGPQFAFSCKRLILLSPQGQIVGGYRESTPARLPFFLLPV